MAESSSHNLSSPEITPKEEPVTLDKPESPNPFLPADQIEFTFEEIAFTTNNEIALLYPSHLNSEYFREVSDFISKCCLKEAFTKAPTQYKEYLCGIRGDISINTFRNALRAHYLPHSSMYVSPPSITIVRPWFATIGYSREIGGKGTLKKSFLPPSVHNWALKPNQSEGPPFTDHMKAICNLDVPMDFKAPKPSSQTEEVPQGKNPGAKSGLRRKQSSKHTSVSNTKASKSKTGQSKKETQSSLAKDKSPNHPSPPTPVVGEMHKEAQQVAGYPSLGATSEERAHPQLRHDALSDSTAEADPGLSAPNTFTTGAVEISKKIKLEDLSDLLKDTRSAFFTLDSPQDKPIISQKDELEQQKAKAEAEVASLKARPSYPKINQLTNLLVTSLKLEFSKLLALHDFASCLPTALKELPSKFTKLSGEIKKLKKHVQEIEIELPGDLKEIPTKLETFTSTISSLSSQVAELKNIQWELPAEFQALPSQVSSVQEKLKSLDSLPSLLNKVIDTLNRFATVVENASGDARNNVPSAGQASASPAEEEKNHQGC
ncbi:hypothetical protein Tco_0368919 [Tanacetum coccineum]